MPTHPRTLRLYNQQRHRDLDRAYLQEAIDALLTEVRAAPSTYPKDSLAFASRQRLPKAVQKHMDALEASAEDFGFWKEELLRLVTAVATQQKLNASAR